jgi:hypothetical protein
MYSSPRFQKIHTTNRSVFCIVLTIQVFVNTLHFKIALGNYAVLLRQVVGMPIIYDFLFDIKFIHVQCITAILRQSCACFFSWLVLF